MAYELIDESMLAERIARGVEPVWSPSGTELF